MIRKAVIFRGETRPQICIMSNLKLVVVVKRNYIFPISFPFDSSSAVRSDFKSRRNKLTIRHAVIVKTNNYFITRGVFHVYMM